jgi:hypothetical protein
MERIERVWKGSEPVWWRAAAGAARASVGSRNLVPLGRLRPFTGHSRYVALANPITFTEVNSKHEERRFAVAWQNLKGVRKAISLSTYIYIHTYHSQFTPEGAAEASQTFLRDAHVLPKLCSYEIL